MIGHCKDCMWWVEKYDYSRRTGHTCGHPKILLGYMYSPETMESDEVVIEDDEGWGWFTGPEFGCVHFEREKVGVDHAD